MVRNGVNQTINTRHQSITVMKEYENKIFEELRFEDYSANRKVGQQVIVAWLPKNLNNFMICLLFLFFKLILLYIYDTY